jgi:carbamoyl-phosphate synthase small subunit
MSSSIGSRSVNKTARLALENGIVFTGVAFGALDKPRTGGEVVFTTSITGYQEILSDPSYAGQIVTMTNPLIGNYGATHEDLESRAPSSSGLVIRELAELYSNWRAEESLDHFLAKSGLLAMEGIDTRKLVRILRSEGSMRGVLSTESLSNEELIGAARALPLMTGQDLTKGVTLKERRSVGSDDSNAPHVAVLDFGIKQNIIRKLHDHGARLTVLPSTTSYEARWSLSLERTGRSGCGERRH